MIKECVVQNGKIINVGPWEYQIETVEREPAEYDTDGDLTKEAVCESIAMNPFPKGATVEERNFEYHPDRGWYEDASVD